MSEFRRMITYLYLYEQGAKRHNVGFAKIEKRGKNCLIEIHMKNTGHSSPSIPVYFYARNNQRLPGILIGSMGLSRGNGDFKAVLEEEPFAGTIYSLEDIKGIFLPLSDQVMFVSQWDDSEFVREQFVDLAKEAAAQKEAGKGGQQGKMAGRRGSQQGALAGRKASQQQMPQAGRSNAPQQNLQAGRGSSPQQVSQAGRGSSPQQTTVSAPEGSAEPGHFRTNGPETSGTSPAVPTAADEHQNADGSTGFGNPGPDAAAAAGHSDIDRELSSGSDFGGSASPAPHSPDFGGPAPHSLEFGGSVSSPHAPVPDSPEQGSPIGPADLEAAEAAPKRMPSGSSATPFPSQPEQEPETLPENWEQKWKFILENYPVMTPFAGDEDTICVRLELKDIRLLPRPYWYLGNNSFLLHGFFNYRYLILGAMEKSGKKRWFLGIPGIYQNPERVMATLFGFPEFRNEKSAPVNTGEFGYWFRYLN